MKILEEGKRLKIKDIYAGMRAVEVLGRVVNKFGVREFEKGERKGKVGNFVIGDETGTIRIVCWHDQTEVVDKIKENDVVLINNVNLGGHVHVGHHSMLMANAAVHQFCRIGEYASIAPFSGTRQDIPPFCIFEGSPAVFAGINIVNLRRNNFSSEDRLFIKKISKLFFIEKLSVSSVELEVNKNLAMKKNNNVQRFLYFIKNSERGISRKDVSRRVGQSINSC